MRKMKRLSEAYEKGFRMTIDDSAKIIFFSDCHRGDKSPADDFAHNENIYIHALRQYLKENFLYIEVGDGDELWENKKFDKIYSSHRQVYDLLSVFAKDGRFYMIHGNHDLYWTLEKNAKQLEQKLKHNIPMYESIILTYNEHELFCVHGHQVDIVSCRIWKASCFVVRHLWKKLQKYGINDPTSPAQDKYRRNKVERKLQRWSRDRDEYLLAGHTHRPAFPHGKKNKYLNAGSCVHPYCISGIEISGGEIFPVKWAVEADEHGLLCIRKKQDQPGLKLSDFFSQN